MASSTIGFSSVGTVVSLAAGAPTTNDGPGFTALTFKEIGEIENVGDFGAEDNILERTSLKTGAKQKMKGSTDYGDAQFEMAYINADAGQVEMKTASESKLPWSVKIVMQDGTTVYYRALVSSRKVMIGGAEDFTRINATFAITSKPVEIAAT